MKITVVIPVMNERPTLETLARDVIEHIAPHEYRLLFIDDGSTDGSWEELQRLCRAFKHLEAVRLEHNCGKTVALDAGFRLADGDVVLTMDADLQDDPKEIPRLVEALESGLDMVCGWKATRHDPWHKTLPSRVYNAAIAWLFALPLHDTNTGYKLMRTEVAKRLTLFADMHRMVAVEAHLLGYRVGEIAVTHHARKFGQSKYGLERIYRGLRDAYTMWLIYRCPLGPARYFGRWAILCFGSAAAFGSVLLLGRTLRDTTIYPTSVAVIALLVIGGAKALALGVFGMRLLTTVPQGSTLPPIAEHTVERR